MITAFILGFLVAVLSFSLGLIVTLFFSKSDTFERASERIASFKVPVSEIGPVKRPTAQDLRVTKVEEDTEEEMSKVLRDFYTDKES